MQVIVDENGDAIVAVTTILMHDSSSSSPAFFVSLEEEVPEILLVQFPYFLQIGDNLMSIQEAETRNLTTVLTADMEVLLIGETINLTYFAIINPNNVVEGNVSKPVVVNYTTIKQEGIGLMVLYSYLTIMFTAFTVGGKGVQKCCSTSYFWVCTIVASLHFQLSTVPSGKQESFCNSFSAWLFDNFYLEDLRIAAPLL